jgi:energy-coupling factor transporter ATP-binding protein EcfA2
MDSLSFITLHDSLFSPFFMPLPIVAVVGRPNVGKSTIVNRLSGVMDAIVHDEPGVTRDRTYRPAFWQDRDYLVVDTGGLVFDDDTEFLPLIREQVMLVDEGLISAAARPATPLVPPGTLARFRGEGRGG